MDERAFYRESQMVKQAVLNCPYCRTSNSYDLRWLVRRKVDKLTRAERVRNSRQHYRTLLRYLSRYRAGLAGINVLTLAATGLALLAPLPLMVLVDSVIGTKPPTGFLSHVPGAGNRSEPSRMRDHALRR